MKWSYMCNVYGFMITTEDTIQPYFNAHLLYVSELIQATEPGMRNAVIRGVLVLVVCW